MMDNKYKKLIISLFLDAIGMFSYVFPGIGELTDVVWAPLSAWLMLKLYKGTAAKAGAAISFVEEAIPGLDVIPTFTIMWFYTYVFSKSKTTTVVDV